MYKFEDLLNSTNPDVKKLASRLLVLYKELNLIVNSKSSYFNTELNNAKSEEDALLSMFGQCKNVVDEVWEDYEVDKKRNIKRY